MSKSATILLPCLLTGGTEVATLEVARSLLVLGYHVRAVVYFDEVDGVMWNSLAEIGVEIECLGLSRQASHFSPVAFILRLARALLGYRSDLIWVQYMTPTFLPILVSRLFCRQLIAAVHVHGNHYGAAGRRRIRWLARFWCSRFVCVSRESARSFFGAPLPSAVAVLPNTFDPCESASASARDWQEELGWPAETVIIGFVGRLAHNKGPDLLLEAMAELRGKNVDVRAVIVGDGAQRTFLNSVVQRMGLADRTCFVGRLGREKVFSALKGFDIAAVPSREEGFGLSALEAMVAGVPVVATAVDALGELIRDGETGLLCRPNDVADLADVLERLVTDADLRKKLGAGGRAYASQHFSRDGFRMRMARLLGLEDVEGTAP